MTSVGERYPSPLRYPGGKGKLANFMKLLMLENDLVGAEYAEPYAGGASVALELIFEGYADHAHINDINPGVFAFWDAALHATDELCKRITDTDVTVETWRRQRAVHVATQPDPMDLAFATFFLNRANRSGIISGGAIGGLDQTGRWKLDARFNKPELVRRIRKVGRHRSRITLTREDAAVFLHHWATPSGATTLLYLDPPYYVKGRGLYDNFYDHADHEKIVTTVRELAHPWVVSYDAVPEIAAMYNDPSAVRYALNYSAAQSSLGSEIMFFSDDLHRPDDVPSAVSSARVDELRSITFA